MQTVRIERMIALPRGIVWEALVDPVLVSGWLHAEYRLVSGTTPRRFVEPESAADAVLEVSSPALGDIALRLGALAGGPREECTHLSVEVSGEWGRPADLRRLWELRLDQLEDLLRGHPVHWESWSRDHVRESALARIESAQRRAH